MPHGPAIAATPVVLALARGLILAAARLGALILAVPGALGHVVGRLAQTPAPQGGPPPPVGGLQLIGPLGRPCTKKNMPHSPSSPRRGAGHSGGRGEECPGGRMLDRIRDVRPVSILTTPNPEQYIQKHRQTVSTGRWQRRVRRAEAEVQSRPRASRPLVDAAARHGSRQTPSFSCPPPLLSIVYLPTDRAEFPKTATPHALPCRFSMARHTSSHASRAGAWMDGWLTAQTQACAGSA